MPEFNVTRCICHGRSFTEIKEYAHDCDIDSVKELQERGFCSNSCRMCAPYVEMVLETGQTTFEPGAHYKKNDSRA